MIRLWLCLPLCLLLAPSYPIAPLAAVSSTPQQVAPGTAAVDSSLPDPHRDPIGFLEACLKRYDAKVKGYTLTYQNQEMIGGELKPLKIVKVAYRDQPYSVFFEWLQPPNPLVLRALYVEGDNLGADKKSRVKIKTLAPFLLDKPPDGDEAKQQSRYFINQFGLRQAMERVLDSWKAAKLENALHVEYLGQFEVQEAGGRRCYKFHRGKYARPEAHDGVVDLTIYIDCETLLQVGSILLNQQGQKLGEYYFRDIQLNPPFPEWQFTPEALRKK